MSPPPGGVDFAFAFAFDFAFAFAFAFAFDFDFAFALDFAFAFDFDFAFAFAFAFAFDFDFAFALDIAFAFGFAPHVANRCVGWRPRSGASRCALRWGPGSPAKILARPCPLGHCSAPSRIGCDTYPR